MSKRPKGFWQALERLAAGAVMAEWKGELGAEAVAGAGDRVDAQLAAHPATA